VIRIWRGGASPKKYTVAAIKNWREFAPDGRFPKYTVSIGENAPNIILEIESKYPPEDYFDSSNYFIISDRLKQELERFQTVAEYIPIKEVIHKGKPYTDSSFYFANIRDEVECLDETNGQYTYWTKPGWTHRIDEIETLVIDESKAAGHHLFFIARLSGPVFCASEELQSSIVEKGFTGIRFIDPADWH
jgi:hypothetical protein